MSDFLVPRLRVLELPPSPANMRNSESSFVTLKSGRVLMAYVRFAESLSDHGPAVIASRYSDDAGQTWSAEDRVLVPQEGDTNVMCPSFLRLADGRVALFNLRKDRTGVDDTYFCRPWVRYSHDECETFSAPQPVIRVPGYFNLNNDRAVQLSSGRVVLPVSLHPYRTTTHLPPGRSTPEVTYNPSSIVSMYFSDDTRNWFECLNQGFISLPNGRGLQEPGLVELSDGRLLMWARCGIGPGESPKTYQWKAHSSDQGMTWSAFTPWLDFESPTSPMSLVRVPGRKTLIAFWNDRSNRYGLPAPHARSKNRTPLACARSEDDGATWTGHRLIESDHEHGYCYTAIHFVNDHVLLGYSTGGITTRGVLDKMSISRVKLADLLG